MEVTYGVNSFTSYDELTSKQSHLCYSKSSACIKSSESDILKHVPILPTYVDLVNKNDFDMINTNITNIPNIFRNIFMLFNFKL